MLRGRVKLGSVYVVTPDPVAGLMSDQDQLCLCASVTVYMCVCVRAT